MKDDVVDLDAFEKIVAEEKMKSNYFLNDQKIFWAMFYTIPIFHNPTGMTLSPGKLKINILYITKSPLYIIAIEFALIVNKRFRLHFPFSFTRYLKLCPLKCEN